MGKREKKASRALVELPESAELAMCPKDGLVFWKNKWQVFEPLKWAKANAKINGEVNIWDVLPADGAMEVVIGGWISEGHRVEEKHSVRLKWRNVLCDVHRAQAGGYYEATIQLRGGWSGEIFHFVDHRLSKLAQKDRYAFYREKVVKDGLDVFIGSKQAAWKVAQELKIQYGAKLVKSTQLVGVKQGKKIQRLTISARFPTKFEPVPNI